MFHVKSSKNMELYFKNILDNVKEIYRIAEECRKKGYDVSDCVEIPLAKDMADKIEGLVGPKNVSERIRELVSKLGKEPAALEIAKEIVEGKFGNTGNQEELAEQAVRTALAIITEGIVAAPLEGIAHVKIKKNRDGSEYLAIYFAGPIRSAGGTAQALAVLVGDYVRKNMGLNRYTPSEDEIERYVEEVDLYQSEVGSFQYSPKAEEIRTAVKNISIEITGEATDDVEVSGHRDLDRVETNQIRGGALLALVEGVLLKAPKILRHVDKLGIEGWEWLKELKGKTLVMVMIYTTCKAACPRLVADMRNIEKQIPKENLKKVQFIFVSIDPETDTPKRLKAFALENYMDGEQWTFLQGTVNSVREFANVLAVKYKEISPMDFSHSNIISVFNPQGELVHQQEGLGVDNKETVKNIIETSSN